MNLIIGLGNPGRDYAQNRHNIGFMCVNHLAKKHGIRFDKKLGLARTGSGDIAGHRVVLARPQTYMNNSGESVSRLAKRFHVKPDSLIVIHDDLDLPLGKIRLSLGSRSGGHKGINSIIDHLGSRDFYRIRVGIGRPATAEGGAHDKDNEVIDYVLSDFTPEEQKIITPAITIVSEAIVCLIDEGLTAARNKYNRP